MRYDREIKEKLLKSAKSEFLEKRIYEADEQKAISNMKWIIDYLIKGWKGIILMLEEESNE